tara:strand:+ start:38 stop:445 length:408 start_codon:yes stop_codon:yes gene_type:complete
MANGKAGYAMLRGYWKPATCREMRCHEHENGWISTVPRANLPMLTAIYEMRAKGTWEFTEERLDGGLIRFTFPPGLTCFRHLDGTGHMVPIERDPRFLHRPSGRPGQPVRQYDYNQFFDVYNESSHQAKERQKKG